MKVFDLIISRQARETKILIHIFLKKIKEEESLRSIIEGGLETETR